MQLPQAVRYLGQLQNWRAATTVGCNCAAAVPSLPPSPPPQSDATVYLCCCIC